MSLADLTPTTALLPNGISLAHVRAGSGPHLIFIHGAMGDWLSWEPQWDAFVPAYDCISYSRRYSYPNLNQMGSTSHDALVDADDLEGLMKVLRIERAVLIGSSYGGFTALALAARSPRRVCAVVSVEAPMMRYAEMHESGAAAARAFREQTILPARRAFERGDNQAGVQILTGGIVGRDPSDVPKHIMKRRMRNALAARSLSLSDDEFPLIEPEVLADLPMPVLLLSGARTAPIHKEIFCAVSAAMPNAKAKVIEGSGHSVSQQQPERFNLEVLEFLSQSLGGDCRASATVAHVSA